MIIARWDATTESQNVTASPKRSKQQIATSEGMKRYWRRRKAGEAMTAKIINPNKIVLTDDQIEIVDMIKELLALCLEGKIMTVGIVGCRSEGFFSAMKGRQAADLNLACDELKRRILDEVLSSTAERQSRRSSILRN